MAKKKFDDLGNPKGWRKGQYTKVMNDVYKTISKEEIERVRQQRVFDKLDPHTFNWDLALHLDQLRLQKRALQENISKLITSIGNLANQLNRSQEQLDSGKITEQLKDGMTMNQPELTNLMLNISWNKTREVRQIGPILSQLRGIVGFSDFVKAPILPLEDYLAYVDEVKAKLKRLGHDLFD